MAAEKSGPSFEDDIKPLFRDKDRARMEWAFDLWSYDDVKANASDIYAAVKAGKMPPKRDGGPWPPDKVAKFKQWMDDGSLP